MKAIIEELAIDFNEKLTDFFIEKAVSLGYKMTKENIKDFESEIKVTGLNDWTNIHHIDGTRIISFMYITTQEHKDGSYSLTTSVKYY